jgi:hypothetical protein
VEGRERKSLLLAICVPAFSGFRGSLMLTHTPIPCGMLHRHGGCLLPPGACPVAPDVYVCVCMCVRMCVCVCGQV